MRSNDEKTELSYVSYELIVPDNIKEGKKEYKKTEKVLTDMTTEQFSMTFVAAFPSYSQHQIEAWFRKTARSYICRPKYSSFWTPSIQNKSYDSFHQFAMYCFVGSALRCLALPCLALICFVVLCFALRSAALLCLL